MLTKNINILLFGYFLNYQHLIMKVTRMLRGRVSVPLRDPEVTPPRPELWLEVEQLVDTDTEAELVW